MCCCVLLPVPPKASGSPGKSWAACCSLWCGVVYVVPVLWMCSALVNESRRLACGSLPRTRLLACFAPSHHIMHAACLLLCHSALTITMATPCTGDNKSPGRHAAARLAKSKHAQQRLWLRKEAEAVIVMAAASTTSPAPPQLVKQAELVQLLGLLNVRTKLDWSVCCYVCRVALSPSLPSSPCPSITITRASLCDVGIASQPCVPSLMHALIPSIKLYPSPSSPTPPHTTG